jgi:hypothetical protein
MWPMDERAVQEAIRDAIHDGIAEDEPPIQDEEEGVAGRAANALTLEADTLLAMLDRYAFIRPVGAKAVGELRALLLQARNKTRLIRMALDDGGFGLTRHDYQVEADLGRFAALFHVYCGAKTVKSDPPPAPRLWMLQAAADGRRPPRRAK